MWLAMRASIASRLTTVNRARRVCLIADRCRRSRWPMSKKTSALITEVIAKLAFFQIYFSQVQNNFFDFKGEYFYDTSKFVNGKNKGDNSASSFFYLSLKIYKLKGLTTLFKFKASWSVVRLQLVFAAWRLASSAQSTFSTRKSNK